MNEPTVFHSTFSIEKTYPVAPEKVFAAFADPVKKRRWMGGDADGFEIESFELDFRIDHHERWRFRFKGGPLIKTEACFQDIVPNQRIVFVYTMTFDGKRGSSSQTTVEFLPGPKGTTLLFTEQGAFFDGAGAESAKGREEGTRGLFEQLEREVLSA